LHDTALLVIVALLYTAGNSVQAFSEELWQFYLGQFLLSMTFCQWAAARTLFTKTVPAEEVGAIYSVVALVAATAPFASNRAFRRLYDATLDNFPSAFLVLGAACGLADAALNLFLLWRRGDLLYDRKGRPTKWAQKEGIASEEQKVTD